MGCDLLVRHGKNTFTLTPEGEILLQTHQDIEAALHRGLRNIEALKSGQTGTVVLGAVSTGKYFAPFLVRALNLALPKVNIVLRIGNRDKILSDLAANTLDIAIMGRPPREPTVVAMSIGEHPHVLVCSPTSNLLDLEAPTATDLFQETIILREQGSGTRILASRFFDQIGQGRSYRSIEMDSNETIKQAIKAGMGIAIISAHTVHEELANGSLVAIQHERLPLLRHWFILHREDTFLSPAAEAVWTQIIGQNGAFLPKMAI